MTTSDGNIADVFDALFDESPFGIARLDSGGGIIQCNSTLAQMLGLSESALKGRAFADAFAAEDRDDVRAHLAKLVMRTARRNSIENLRLAAKDNGAERAVQLFTTAIERNGELSGLLAHVLDTTERYHLEMGSAHAQKLQALGQLAGSIAHDFNNLITAMLGSCELLLNETRPGSNGYDDLSHIRATALRARDLVRQLLTFARKQPLRPIPLRLDRAIEDLLPMLRPLLGAGIGIDSSHAPQLPLARMDPGRFDQVIVNLAVNARDAMRGSGRLSLSTRAVSFATPTQLADVMMPAGLFVQVEVRDTGTGIPKEIIDDIFQPFFTTKPLGEGTGLGLATVYGIIRQSGGYIGVDSALGAGATFRILLPAAEPAMETVETSTSASRATSMETRPPKQRSTQAATILLVEDDEAVRRFAARALRSRGWKVMEAGDGESALRALAGVAPFEVLLSDMTLPDIHGSVVIEQARRRCPLLKVVVISADISACEEETDRRLFRLSKPFSLAELITCVERVLVEADEPAESLALSDDGATASDPPDLTSGFG